VAVVRYTFTHKQYITASNAFEESVHFATCRKKTTNLY